MFEMGTGVASQLLSPDILLDILTHCCVVASSNLSHILRYAPSILIAPPCTELKSLRKLVCFWFISASHFLDLNQNSFANLLFANLLPLSTFKTK